MQISSPAGGYFSATMAAIPKGHKVVTDRKRMMPRTVGWKEPSSVVGRKLEGMTGRAATPTPG
jgi:hypothetical protein